MKDAGLACYYRQIILEMHIMFSRSGHLIPRVPKLCAFYVFQDLSLVNEQLEFSFLKRHSIQYY